MGEQADIKAADRKPFWFYVVLAALVIVVVAIIQRAMGRLWISKSGSILLWVGEANGPENSQQISDWYTFSHIIHGFLFYGVCRLIGRGKWPLGLCLLISVFIEGTWEVIENTSWVINHYRSQTMSVDYYGDSILNSAFDSVWCITGFLLAWRLPVWVSVVLCVAMEVIVACIIRDNLTLNVLMFIYPFDFIKQWQTGT